jgi:uncharacterized protein YndB with AHSA1/START domain
MAFSFKILIAAPPESVYDRVADVPGHPGWANPNASMKMETVSGEPGAVGTRYRSHALFLKKPIDADIEVTAADRPRRFEFSAVQHQAGKKDVTYIQTFTFEPRDGGTLVTKTVGGGGNPVIGFLAYPAIRADAMTQLRNLKAMLEP